MDWAKAKTILIAVFLVINIFLGYRIIDAGTGSIAYVDDEKIKLAADYLAEKNITVNGKIPAKKVGMPSITVKYKLFNKEDIVESFFSSEEITAVSTEGNIIELRGKNIEFSIKNSRELYYKDNSIKPAAAIDEKVCRKSIKSFLDRLGMKDDADLRAVEDIEGYTRFVYGQSFKGITICNSVMEFYVNDTGIYRANIVWFETIRQAGKKADVISPVTALLYLPKHYKNNLAAGMKVLEIQQGYYFGIGAAGKVDVSKVVEGTAFPVWEIVTDRDIIYINAYNEKVEGVKKRQ